MNAPRFLVSVCLLLSLFAAAAPAQDENLIPNRLAVAKVGEWASYTLADGYTQKLTVVKRSGPGPDDLVTIRVENIYDGEVVETHEVTEKAGDAFSSPGVPAEEGVFVAVRTDIAQVKDRNVVAGIVEINKYLGTEDQVVTEWWTTAEIPVFGIVKRVENGVVVWELADWGE